MFEGLFSPMHLILILAIALIIFGPGKLPDLGEALGRSIREFQKAVSEATGDKAAVAASAPTAAIAERATLCCAACGAESSQQNSFCGSCGHVLAQPAYPSE
jgi:sec-independent protein translocase protein TatA